MTIQKAIFKLPVEYGISRDVEIGSAQVINMYTIPANDTTQGVAWVPVSGFKTKLEVGEGPHRASFVFNGDGYLYIVSGENVVRLDALLTPTPIGTVNSGAGYIGIDANETQIILVDGTNGFIFDTVSSLYSTIAFGFPFNPSDVTMLDNYFIAIQQGDTKFYVSDLGNGLSWNVLNFAIFESNPDRLIAVKTLKRRLYLFGHQSTEVWYDAGATDFPFIRDNNSLFEHGVIAPDTVKEGFEIMMYVAQNKSGPAGVMLVEGTSFPQKVSTPEIDLLLQTIENISDASAILYKENGFTFYQLSFTTANKTIVYIVETNRWHQIEMKDGSRSLIRTHAYYANMHLVGMFNSNFLSELSYKIFDFNNDLIRCRLISPAFFSNTNERIRIDRFQLEAITGLPEGTLPNQNAYPALNELIISNDEPDVILSISRNSGRTYGNGIRGNMSRLGAYLARVMWRRLGVQRQRRVVIQLEFPYKVPFNIIGTYFTYEVLPQ